LFVVVLKMAPRRERSLAAASGEAVTFFAKTKNLEKETLEKEMKRGAVRSSVVVF
jgi:hypothetical protein